MKKPKWPKGKTVKDGFEVIALIPAVLTLVMMSALFMNCAPTFEYYTTEPKLPDYLKNKEIVSIDTVNTYKGKSYLYKLRTAK